jgi:hypothetical protein
MPCPGTRWVRTFRRADFTLRRSVGLLKREGKRVCLAHDGLTGEGFGELFHSCRVAKLSRRRVAVLHPYTDGLSQAELGIPQLPESE